MAAALVPNEAPLYAGPSDRTVSYASLTDGTARTAPTAISADRAASEPEDPTDRDGGVSPAVTAQHSVPTGRTMRPFAHDPAERIGTILPERPPRI